MRRRTLLATASLAAPTLLARPYVARAASAGVLKIG